MILECVRTVTHQAQLESPFVRDSNRDASGPLAGEFIRAECFERNAPKFEIHEFVVIVEAIPIEMEPSRPLVSPRTLGWSLCSMPSPAASCFSSAVVRKFFIKLPLASLSIIFVAIAKRKLNSNFVRVHDQVA